MRPLTAISCVPAQVALAYRYLCERMETHA